MVCRVMYEICKYTVELVMYIYTHWALIFEVFEIIFTVLWWWWLWWLLRLRYYTALNSYSFLQIMNTGTFFCMSFYILWNRNMDKLLLNEVYHSTGWCTYVCITTHIICTSCMYIIRTIRYFCIWVVKLVELKKIEISSSIWIATICEYIIIANFCDNIIIYTYTKVS